MIFKFQASKLCDYFPKIANVKIVKKIRIMHVMLNKTLIYKDII